MVVLDADKEGFLRSERALIQTIGRAARNVRGRAVMFADTVTKSMRNCILATYRRREKQQAYNSKHGLSPRSAVGSGTCSLFDIEQDALKTELLVCCRMLPYAAVCCRMLRYADARKTELQAIQYIEGRAEQTSADFEGGGAHQLPSPKRKRGRKVQDEGGERVGGVSRSGGGRGERSAGAYSSGAAKRLIESLESLDVCAEEAAREEGYLLAQEGHPLAEVVGREEAEEAAGEELEEEV